VAVVVLVHGIAQEQKSADTLEHEWLADLAGGIRLAGYSELADRIRHGRFASNGIDVRMAFYGDLFLGSDQQGSGPPQLKAQAEQLADTLALEWLQRAATRASTQRTNQIASRELAYLQREIGEEQGAGATKRRALKSLAKIRWFAPFGAGFAERFIWRALGQVTTYFTDDELRATATERVTNLIDSDTRVIIGHSLGSVVAYEAAQQLSSPLPLLVTLGSPLGLRTIIYEKLRPQPPGFPNLVTRWVNVADRDDFIAAEPDLTKMFSHGKPANAVFDGAYTVDNGAKPHQAGYYLTKQRVGRPVGETLALQ
jgi:hypothetical protein